MEPFAIFVGDSSLVLKKTNLNGSAENEVSMTCDTPKQCTMKIGPAKFHCNFPPFFFFCYQEVSANIFKYLSSSSFCRI
jgi:hypothetical protein